MKKENEEETETDEYTEEEWPTDEEIEKEVEEKINEMEEQGWKETSFTFKTQEHKAQFLEARRRYFVTKDEYYGGRFAAAMWFARYAMQHDSMMVTILRVGAAKWGVDDLEEMKMFFAQAYALGALEAYKRAQAAIAASVPLCDLETDGSSAKREKLYQKLKALFDSPPHVPIKAKRGRKPLRELDIIADE